MYHCVPGKLVSTYALENQMGCWSNEPEAHLNFTQLKYFFKSMILAPI